MPRFQQCCQPARILRTLIRASVISMQIIRTLCFVYLHKYSRTRRLTLLQILSAFFPCRCFILCLDYIICACTYQYGIINNYLVNFLSIIYTCTYIPIISQICYTGTKGGENMSQTEAQLRAAKKYRKKFEYLQIRVPAEEKEAICKHVEATGESLNTFIRNAIAEAMERSTSK